MMNNDIKVTFPPLVEGQEGWKLYSQYQVPIGRDPWPWRDRVIFRVLMFFHACVDKMWRLIWTKAQPFKEPPMKYETKYP